MNPVALVLVLVLLGGFIYLFIKQRQLLALYVILVVLIIPKTNILALTAESNAGLRSEDIIIALFMLFTVIGERCKSYRKVFSNSIFKLFLLYLFSSVVSFIVGIVSTYTFSLSLSFFGLLRKVEYFCFIFVGYDFYHYNQGEARTILKKTLNVFTVFTAVFSLFQVLGIIGSFRFGVYDSTSFLGCAVGTFNGHYELGAFFIIVAIIYFYDILQGIDNKWVNFVYFVLCLLLILFSKSRTSLLVVMIILFLMVIVYCSKKIKICTISFGIGVVLLSLFLVKFTNLHVLERFRSLRISSLLNSIDYYFNHRSYAEYVDVLRSGTSMENYVLQSGDVSFNVRMFKWMAMLDVLTKFPLFGYGFGSNSVMDGNYIKLLAENGLIGFTMFLSLFAVIVRKAQKHKGGGYVVWMVFSLFLGAVLIDLFEASKVMEFVWFIVGVYCIAENKNEKQELLNDNKYPKQQISNKWS